MGNTAYCECVDIPHDDHYVVGEEKERMNQYLAQELQKNQFEQILTSRIVYENPLSDNPSISKPGTPKLQIGSDHGHPLSQIGLDSVNQNQREPFAAISQNLSDHSLNISNRVSIPIPIKDEIADNLPKQIQTNYENGGYFKRTVTFNDPTSGHGEIILPSVGLEYKGQIHSNQPHGFGTEKLNGYVYEGQFSEGLKHGKGKLTCPNGETYIGVFEKNILVGSDILVQRDGDLMGNLVSQDEIEITLIPVT